MPRHTTDIKLLKERNKRIAYAFNTLYHHNRLRLDDVIYRLKWERFFVSEDTIKKALKTHNINCPKFSFKLPHKEGKNLTEARNNHLNERLDFLFSNKRIRYDDVITQLSEKEFFLKKKTIEMLIKK